MDSSCYAIILVGGSPLTDPVYYPTCPVHAPAFSPPSSAPPSCKCHKKNHRYSGIREQDQLSLEFLQILLETYSNVTAVQSCSVCLNTLEAGPVNRTTILLIDLDQPSEPSPYLSASDSASISGLSCNQHDSGVGQEEDMTGFEFLKLLAQSITSGRVSNVFPIVCSRTYSPELILHCLNLGAADFLVKPIGVETVKSLWLSVHRQIKPETNDANQRKLKRRSRILEDRVSTVLSQDGKLGELIVGYYTPPVKLIDPIDFPKMDGATMRERIMLLRGQVCSWHFSPHDLTEEDLLRCVALIFQDVLALDGLNDQLRISPSTLHKFILTICSSYHASNPYHNFLHAVDVLQSTYYFLRCTSVIPSGKRSTMNSQSKQGNSQVKSWIRAKDIFALLVAGLGHDIGHPGVNNFYMVNARTPLARLYNDRAVLENYHATSLFLIFRKHGLNFFPDGDREGEEFRQTVINTILATDMSSHFDYIRKIQDQKDRIQRGELYDEDRLLLGAAMVKCADISNPSRPFHIAERWSTALLKEFSMQAGLERKMGFPVCMPVDLRNLGQQAKSQIDFINTWAKPLFEAVTLLFPELCFCLENLKCNTSQWERLRVMEGRTGKRMSLGVILKAGHPKIKKSLAEDEPIPEPVKNRRPLSLPGKDAIPLLRPAGSFHRKRLSSKDTVATLAAAAATAPAPPANKANSNRLSIIGLTNQGFSDAISALLISKDN